MYNIERGTENRGEEQRNEIIRGCRLHGAIRSVEIAEGGVVRGE